MGINLQFRLTRETSLFDELHAREFGQRRFFPGCEVEVHRSAVLELARGPARRVEETHACRLVTTRLDALIQAGLFEGPIRIADVAIFLQKTHDVGGADGSA